MISRSARRIAVVVVGQFLFGSGIAGHDVRAEGPQPTKRPAEFGVVVEKDVMIPMRDGVRLAALFEGWVRDEPGWELCAPRPFSLVCFRLEGSDEANAALLERVNATGEIFISHTRLAGRYVLRLAVGSARTAEEDVRVAWDVLRREAAQIGR